MSTAPKRRPPRVRVPVPGFAAVQVLITLPSGARMKLRATVKEDTAWTFWHAFTDEKPGSK